jgi:hypothetical protein
VECGGIPHLAKHERDAPNFLHEALDKAARAPFFRGRAHEVRGATKLHRKSGMWGTRGSRQGQAFRSELISHLLNYVSPTTKGMEGLCPVFFVRLTQSSLGEFRYEVPRQSERGWPQAGVIIVK